MRATFLLTLIPSLIAVALIAFVVREKPHTGSAARILARNEPPPRAFHRYLVGVGIAGLGDFSNTLLILWATHGHRVRLQRAAVFAMAFYIGYNVVYTLTAI
jgi:hypothetical protein